MPIYRQNTAGKINNVYRGNNKLGGVYRQNASQKLWPSEVVYYEGELTFNDFYNAKQITLPSSTPDNVMYRYIADSQGEIFATYTPKDYTGTDMIGIFYALSEASIILKGITNTSNIYCSLGKFSNTDYQAYLGPNRIFICYASRNHTTFQRFNIKGGYYTSLRFKIFNYL